MMARALCGQDGTWRPPPERWARALSTRIGTICTGRHVPYGLIFTNP